jgi:hypothetical protein
MKFLVITGRNGLEKESVKSELEVVDLVKEVSELYQKKILESSFAFMGSGSAFVLNANSHGGAISIDSIQSSFQISFP